MYKVSQAMTDIVLRLGWPVITRYVPDQFRFVSWQGTPVAVKIARQGEYVLAHAVTCPSLTDTFALLVLGRYTVRVCIYPQDYCGSSSGYGVKIFEFYAPYNV